MTGKSSDVNRNRDWAKRKVVRPRSIRFLPCATTARLGSNATEVGAVGAVRRESIRPGILVISFSAGPTNEAILRTSAVRNSCARFCGGEAFLLGFFTVRFPLPLA